MDSAKAYLLLVNLPGETHRSPEEHCGLAFVKAFVERAEVQVDILDAYAFGWDDARCHLQYDVWLRRCGDGRRFVGVSPFVSSHSHLEAFGEHVRRMDPECTIFAGGHYATLNKERLLRDLPWLDAIVVGEGELSVLELVQRGVAGPVAGVYIRGRESSFLPRERIKDLDALPFQSRYLSLADLKGQPFCITTSRGCYGECSFCSISTFYRCNEPSVKQTCRSAQSVSDEIHGLVEKYGIRALKIVDDNFFRMNDDRFLPDLVGRIEGLDLSIRLSARPNDITPERAALLKRMGAVVVAIGVESANAASLRLFRKGIGTEASERAIRLLREQGITCLANFIMFDPVVDLAGLSSNCDFVARHLDDCVFHRVNSRLWVRQTDPIVEDLVRMGLCERAGFPYLKCRYADRAVASIRRDFDSYCEGQMAEYYRHADVVMANGVCGNEADFDYVRNVTATDVEELRSLIAAERPVAGGRG